MKALGLIGGTSWHSTIDYYRIINQSVNDHFGNNTNPPLMINTLNQAEVHRFQDENKWDSIASMFVIAGKNLHRAGAESVMFCANTPHKIYDKVESALEIPIIHIADATAQAIKEKQIKKVGFIGTKFTMKEDFILKRIEKNGIEVLVPTDDDVIDELHRIIIEELTYNKIASKSKMYVLAVIQDMIKQGAQGIILGCTEFPLMIFEKDLPVPIFNTSEIHAHAGVNFILAKL